MPIPLAAVVAYLGVGGEIRLLGLRTSALAIALYIAGLGMASVGTQFALMRATQAFAIGESPRVSEIIATIGDVRGFATFLTTKLLYGGMKIVVILFGFIPAVGAILFSLQGSGGRLDRIFQGPVILVFLLGILIGALLGIVLSLLFVLFFGLSPAIASLEHSGPLGAFRRSRELLAGRKLDYLVLLFMRNLLLQVPTFVFLGPTYIAQIVNTPQRGITAVIGALPFQMGGQVGASVVEGQPLSLVLLSALGAFLFYVAEGPILAGTWANYYLAARGEEVVAVAVASARGRSFS